ncbi:MAG: hypothetical protein ACQES9_11655 [Myxococcota bacterium]
MKKYISFILISLGLAVFTQSCYSPDLNEEPFACGGDHGNGECPEGYGCYGGLCLESAPSCYADDQFFGEIGGSSDKDFEPNNTPDQAYIMTCGGVPEQDTSCPNRYGGEFTYKNLTICGKGDIDIYKVYLVNGETFSVTMNIDPGSTSNYLYIILFKETIDADGNKTWNTSDPDAYSYSSREVDELTYEAQNNGWHYLMVYGGKFSYLNRYTLEWFFESPNQTE